MTTTPGAGRHLDAATTGHDTTPADFGRLGSNGTRVGIDLQAYLRPATT
ncbi:MAG: hypothetical protein QOH43_923 [Solirubrobacteraceae bacterium]|nr:hypothetical protein [Solirubrobacteraceae bacterium]